MGEYTVTSLVKGEPKSWNGPHGTIYYHSVMVAEHDKPLSVGKKEPNSIKVGDTLYGDITETDYLEDKFKASPPPPQNTSTPVKTDSSQYLKDLSDAPLRIYSASIGYFDTQGLINDKNYYHKFVTYIQDITNDLLNMSESIRKDELKPIESVKKVFKEAEPLPLPPEDAYDED